MSVIYQSILRYSNAGAFVPPNDPPGWTQYNFNSGYSANGFSVVDLTAGASINEVTSGNPTNRLLELIPAGGQSVLLTTNQPNFDSTVGVTGEAQFRITGTGEYAGFQIRYDNGVVNFTAAENWVELNLPSGWSVEGNVGVGSPDVDAQVVETAGISLNTDYVFRLTIDGSREVKLYQDEVDLFPAETLILPYENYPTFQFMFWGEGGA